MNVNLASYFLTFSGKASEMKCKSSVKYSFCLCSKQILIQASRCLLQFPQNFEDPFEDNMDDFAKLIESEK